MRPKIRMVGSVVPWRSGASVAARSSGRSSRKRRVGDSGLASFGEQGAPETPDALRQVCRAELPIHASPPQFVTCAEMVADGSVTGSATLDSDGFDDVDSDTAWPPDGRA